MSQGDYYILSADRSVIPVRSIRRWAAWFESSGTQRIVARDRCGEYEISTIFLGLNHSFSESSTPVLWETMVFRGQVWVELAGRSKDLPREIDKTRCSGTWEHAEAMHQSVRERVEALIALDVEPTHDQRRVIPIDELTDTGTGNERLIQP